MEDFLDCYPHITQFTSHPAPSPVEPINTTCTAANLSISAMALKMKKRGARTYAAVAAKISLRFAVVKNVIHNENTIVNPAIAPNLARMLEIS
jgi:hypothetical protein